MWKKIPKSNYLRFLYIHLIRCCLCTYHNLLPFQVKSDLMYEVTCLTGAFRRPCVHQVAAKDTEIGTWSDWSVAVHATPWIEEPKQITSTTEADPVIGGLISLKPVPTAQTVALTITTHKIKYITLTSEPGLGIGRLMFIKGTTMSIYLSLQIIRLKIVRFFFFGAIWTHFGQTK